MNELTMDSVFKRLRRLCQSQNEAIQMIDDLHKKITENDHELANIVTLAGGWRYIAETEGLEIKPKEAE